MIFTDILLLAALGLFVLAWWVRATPRRAAVLTLSALIALAAGIVGVLDDRWQAGAGVAVAALLLLVLLVNSWRKAHVQGGATIFSGAFFALLAGVAAAALLLFPVDALPTPSGPHAVGVRTFEVTDTSRIGVLGAAADAPRRLLVRVWYPATRVEGQQPRHYFTQAEARSTAHGLGALVGFPPFLSYLKHVRTNSYDDAPLIADAKQLPVVFYSHGYLSFLGQNTALMEDLASHGYVVFSLQHTYDSSPTVFSDGTIAPVAEEITSAVSPPPSDAMRRAIVGALDERLGGLLDLIEEEMTRDSRIAARSAPHWVLDRLFLHDQLQNGGAPPNVAEIVAASDLSRVGEMGMSFGGSTSGAICRIDPRCAAGVNLDGADYHLLALNAEMPMPFMMFHSDPGLIYASMGETTAAARTFNEFSYEPIAEAGAQRHVYRFALRDTHHLGLSDFSLFVRRPVRDALFGAAPGAVTVGAQNAFVRGFFDRHLRGAADAFPSQQLAAYEAWVRRVDVSDVRAWWAQLPEAERAALVERIAHARAAAPSGAIAAARGAP